LASLFVAVLASVTGPLAYKVLKNAEPVMLTPQSREKDLDLSP